MIVIIILLPRTLPVPIWSPGLDHCINASLFSANDHHFAMNIRPCVVNRLLYPPTTTYQKDFKSEQFLTVIKRINSINGHHGWKNRAIEEYSTDIPWKLYIASNRPHNPATAGRWWLLNQENIVSSRQCEQSRCDYLLVAGCWLLYLLLLPH